GGLVGGNFDQSMMLGNDMNRDKSMIIEYYVFTVGLGQGKYSYAAAVGLFQSVISLTLTGITAKISNKYSEVSLF
ncbi:MAG: sugar ABC transporter permease, partial [Oscillospiraceae bacterium]